MLSRIPQKEWLSTPELKRALDCHLISIYRWIRRGQLRAYKIRATRQNAYKRADVEAFIRARFVPQLIDGGGRGQHGGTRKRRDGAPEGSEGSPA